MYYGGLSPSEMFAEGRNVETTTDALPRVTEETPLFRNITFKNITCNGASQAVFLQGLPEQNLENIIFENIDIKADNGLACIDADSISIKGIRLITKNSPVLRIINSMNIEIEKLDVPNNQNPFIDIKGRKSKNISIRSINPGDPGRGIIGNEVDARTIKIL
jgi:hypothetical protein